MDNCTPVDEIDSINDEDLLRSMLDKSEDLDLRRRIRSRLRALNKAKPSVAVSGVDGNEKVFSRQQQLPAKVHQPKETRAAAPWTGVKKSDEVDGRQKENFKLSYQSSATNERQSVTLRNVDQNLMTNKPKEPSKEQRLESVALRKVNDAKPSTSNDRTTSAKTDFLDGKRLRKVEDTKSTNETGRQSTAQRKNDILETVTLRKVDVPKATVASTTSKTTARGLTPKMAREHFKGIDAASGVKVEGGSYSQRNSSTSNIRQAMLEWCRYRVAGYENVDIVDFSESWSNGMAFCALIHSFFPDAFDYNQLDPNNKETNLRLAFTTAEQCGGVFPLLDVEDMILAGPSPDWKCIFTYVNSIYSELAAPKKKSIHEPCAADEEFLQEDTKELVDCNDGGN